MPGTLAWKRAGRLASPTGTQKPARNAGLKPGPDDAPATAHPAARSGQSAEDISPSPHRHGAGAQPQNQARPWVDRPLGCSSVGTSEREHPRPQSLPPTLSGGGSIAAGPGPGAERRLCLVP